MSRDKCVHCLKISRKKTKDHLFPKSWYPDSTPQNVQRWTLPSCLQCNRTLGRLETELFVRLALCVDPTKLQASGVSKNAQRSLGVGVPPGELSAKEKAHRRASLESVFKGAKRLKDAPDEVLMPGLGPHSKSDVGNQIMIQIRDSTVRTVAEKIVRGCEYKLNSESYIDKPREVKISLPEKDSVANLAQIFAIMPKTELGPGFEITRGENPPTDAEHIVLYKIVVWGTVVIYATIALERMHIMYEKLSPTLSPNDPETAESSPTESGATKR